MAEILTFEWDALADELKVGGVTYKKGTFRALGGTIIGGHGGMVLEARGGGVFQVAVPAQYVPKKLNPVQMEPPAVAPAAAAPVAHTVAPAMVTSQVKP